MPRPSNPENRRWNFYYIAGMPAQICGGGVDLTSEEAIAKIMEEYPGQKNSIKITISSNDRMIRRGYVWQTFR